jgi:hypothetical protein
VVVVDLLVLDVCYTELVVPRTGDSPKTFSSTKYERCFN